MIPAVRRNNLGASGFSESGLQTRRLNAPRGQERVVRKTKRVRPRMKKWNTGVSHHLSLTKAAVGESPKKRCVIWPLLSSLKSSLS